MSETIVGLLHEWQRLSTILSNARTLEAEVSLKATGARNIVIAAEKDESVAWKALEVERLRIRGRDQS